MRVVRDRPRARRRPASTGKQTPYPGTACENRPTRSGAQSEIRNRCPENRRGESARPSANRARLQTTSVDAKTCTMRRKKAARRRFRSKVSRQATSTEPTSRFARFINTRKTTLLYLLRFALLSGVELTAYHFVPLPLRPARIRGGVHPSVSRYLRSLGGRRIVSRRLPCSRRGDRHPRSVQSHFRYELRRDGCLYSLFVRGHCVSFDPAPAHPRAHGRALGFARDQCRAHREPLLSGCSLSVLLRVLPC